MLRSKPASVTVLMVAAFVGAALWTERSAWSGQAADTNSAAQRERAIDALDSCLQERFEDTNQDFGIARVTPRGAIPHRFVPESLKEYAAVRQIESAKLEVAIYVGGLRLLIPEPPAREGQATRNLLKGPVRVNTPGNGAVLPAVGAIRDEARRALSGFGATDRYEFQKDGWRFTARPIPASEGICLSCHHGEIAFSDPPTKKRGRVFSIGDPLGVVIYGYRPLP